MRRLAALLMLAILCAAPARAQDRGRIPVEDRAAAEAGLRGTVGEPADSAPAEPGSASALADLIPAPLPVAPAGFASGEAVQQCRRSCAREYYFCLSAEDEICPPQWVKCNARCGG